MPSLFDPADLPEPAAILARHRALVLVDVGLGGDYPCFFWDTDGPHGPLALWDNGSGDEYRIRAWPDGALLWGFDHESSMSPWGREDGRDDWPGLFDGLPERFRAVIDAQPQQRRSVTFCFWHEGGGWQSGSPEVPDWEQLDDPQGVAGVLDHVLHSHGAGDYVRDYYQRPELEDAALALVTAVESDGALTTELVAPFAAGKSAGDLLGYARRLGLRA
jgi:hypothetical protein